MTWLDLWHIVGLERIHLVNNHLLDQVEAGDRIRRLLLKKRKKRYAGRKNHKWHVSKTAVIITFCIFLNCKFLG